MKKTEAIVFDLDGTLLNTIEDLTDALNLVLKSKGFPADHTSEDCKKFVGHGARTMVERSLPPDHRDNDTIDACLKMLREEYTRNWNNKTHLYEGIPELLDSLTGMGIPMCILTNKPESNTQQIAGEYFTQWPFRIIRGAREDIPLKPDPTASLQITAALDVKPKNCIHVGDSAVDMRTAKAANMYAIGVTWGFRSKEEITNAGADVLIDKPIDLLKYLSPQKT